LLQILKKPYFCSVQTTGTYLKKAAAVLLLGLFGFILAEKNSHEHTRYSTDELQGHTMVHQPGTCLICEFQIAADAELPAVPVFNPPVVFLNIVSATAFTQISAADIAQQSLRGPPSI
jgi:hypothetical protein